MECEGVRERDGVSERESVGVCKHDSTERGEG